jgi:hypothetical protein
MDHETRLRLMFDEWSALDEAVMKGGLTEILGWPWESQNPGVQTAWESLTQPEHLANLEFRLSDRGGKMNDWAEAVTRKAVEVCRSRAADRPINISPPAFLR